MVDDLQKSTLALRVVKNLIIATPTLALHDVAIKQAATLAKLDSIQGECLAELLELFKIATAKNCIDKSIAEGMIKNVELNSRTVAACLAIMCVNDSKFAGLKGDFLKMAQDSDPKNQVRGALCIGQVCILSDMSSEKVLLDIVKKGFESENSDVRQAASICLGDCAIGNPKFFLVKVFEFVNNIDIRQRYLFLNTIREILVHKISSVQDFLPQLINLLMSQATNSEDSIRSIVAECLGLLFAEQPMEMFEEFEPGFLKGNEVMKATLARSVKFSGQKADVKGNELGY